MQQRKVIATWNSDRDLWETDQHSIFGHLDVFSETWPTSGMTRNGTAYELPTSERHTDGTGSSSLLPTPNTMDSLPARTGEAMERQLRRGEGPDASRRTTMGNLREDILQTVDPDIFKNPKLLPTPLTTDDGGSNDAQFRRDSLTLRTLARVTPAEHASLNELTPQQRGELMNQRSEDGRPLLADQLHHLQNQQDETGNHNLAQSSLSG